MQNDTVHLRTDGIIEVDSAGNKTVFIIRGMGEAIKALARIQRENKKSVLVLDDLRKMGSVPPEGRRLVVELAKTLDYDRVAMVGSNGVLRIGANLMFQATGKSEKIKYFSDYDEAVAWLLAFDA
jgi:UDP-N-acetylmuramyl pentapeptide synthase